MRKGDLVRWYEYYADGDIVRDSGIGIILESDQWRHDEESSLRFSSIVHVIFKVYKLNEGTCEWFSDHHVDVLSPMNRINKTNYGGET